MNTSHAQLQKDTNFRVLGILHANPRKLPCQVDNSKLEISLTNSLGISTIGLNYCLEVLIDNGLVMVNGVCQCKNKFGYIYLLTPQASAEYDAQHAEIADLQDEASRAKSGPRTPNSTEARN
jgi:hypothetical protein